MQPELAAATYSTTYPLFDNTMKEPPPPAAAHRAAAAQDLVTWPDEHIFIYGVIIYGHLSRNLDIGILSATLYLSISP
jgi:hypothetical protein